jgi:hypothetical protein
MKLKNIKAASIAIIGWSVVLTGCLKDKDFDNGLIQSVHGNTGKVVSLASNVQSQTNFAALAYNNSDNDTVVDFLPVELSNGDAPAPQDLHVTIVQVDSLVNNLDTANYNSGTGIFDYVVPTGVTIVNPVVTIKKGSYQGFLQIKFKPSAYLGQDVALGFRITSIQEQGYTVSGNLKDAVQSIIIKNKYDGFYGGVIKTTGWGAYGIADGVSNTVPSSANLGLFTVGANSLSFHTSLGSEATLEPAFQTSGAATVFGAASPLFTFDLTTNKLIGMANLDPDDGRGRNFLMNPAVTDSRYDPATKTMYLSYIMVQNGRPNQFFYDTLTYSGPR